MFPTINPKERATMNITAVITQTSERIIAHLSGSDRLKLYLFIALKKATIPKTRPKP